MRNIFTKDEKGFTGLEAAIVLVAFVVVAAVLSYVMLGAGFYTTQKSQEVVHTGVTQASSSVELSGDVIAKGDDDANPDTAPTKIDIITLFLQPTAGGSAVDLSQTLITISAPGCPPKDLKMPDGAVYDDIASDGIDASASTFGITAIYNDNGNKNLLLEKGEKFEVQIALDTAILDVVNGGAAGTSIGANGEFQLEIKPPQGASYTIHRTAPASISAIMALN
ncbi:MAG: flagellin [Methanosarcina mazei]|nr:flagellin [Methanosarcina mazei]